MKRSEAYHILGKMWEDATEEQAEAISIAQDDIEFVDLMPNDMVVVVRCKDCNKSKESRVVEGWRWCKTDQHSHRADHFCSYGERRGSE